MLLIEGIEEDGALKSGLIGLAAVDEGELHWMSRPARQAGLTSYFLDGKQEDYQWPTADRKIDPSRSAWEIIGMIGDSRFRSVPSTRITQA